MSTYVISDIHGCFDIFCRLIAKIGFSDGDILILGGDYVDRGTQSTEMLRWLEHKPLNVFPLLGNHDAMFLGYLEDFLSYAESDYDGLDFESEREMLKIYGHFRYFIKVNDKFRGTLFDYYGTFEEIIRKGTTLSELKRWHGMLAGMPYIHKLRVNQKPCIIVHAGYVESYDDIRGKYESIEDFYLNAREDAYTIGGLQDGTVIAGHTPTVNMDYMTYNEGLIFKYYSEEKNCIYFDIDCGSVFRDMIPWARLACLRLEDEAEFYE